MTHLIPSTLTTEDALLPDHWFQADGATPIRLYKDNVSRVRRFAGWLDTSDHHWLDPDLRAYRDHLYNEGLAPSSVSTHLASVRARYHEVLRDNHFRRWLYQQLPNDLPPSDRKALVDERIERLRNAIDPAIAPVQQTKVQDRADDEHMRLSASEAERLLAAPDTDSLIGLRDRALLAVLVGLGLREQELCDLTVADLEREFGGELAAFISQGKGKKQRLVPYGEHLWVLRFVRVWLENAGIDTGPVFRGFYRGGKTRETALSTRAVQKIVGSYTFLSDTGRAIGVRPHDLRRTYARLCYDAGMDLLAIQRNMGHSGAETTRGYIGNLDGAMRRSRSGIDL